MVEDASQENHIVLQMLVPLGHVSLFEQPLQSGAVFLVHFHSSRVHDVFLEQDVKGLHVVLPAVCSKGHSQGHGEHDLRIEDTGQSLKDGLSLGLGAEKLLENFHEDVYELIKEIIGIAFVVTVQNL